ncbi:MAG: acyltransferase [Candidatus Thalassarchaeaceae archaeon]
MRLRYIDRIRAIAILCMVQVHTAAIIPPEGISVGHPIAFVSAAIGGMAAPMFVTISGWGIYRSAIRRRKIADNGISSWMYWIIPRIIILTICQLLVNSALSIDRGGRFDWMTPGVLTLLALASIIGPLMVYLTKKQRFSMMLIFMISPIIIGDLNGNDLYWSERVSSIGIEEWVERLLLNGTYPALPWLTFIFLGSLIDEDKENLDNQNMVVKVGLIIIAISMIYSFYERIPWALTEGNAILTFFPANTMFILTSSIFVVILFRILGGEEISGGEPFGGDKMSWLEPAGRLSLTVYVVHFILLGIIAYEMQNQPRLEIYNAFLLTILHTSIWIPLSIWHEKYAPTISFEELLRKFN